MKNCHWARERFARRKFSYCQPKGLKRFMSLACRLYIYIAQEKAVTNLTPPTIPSQRITCIQNTQSIWQICLFVSIFFFHFSAQIETTRWEDLIDFCFEASIQCRLFASLSLLSFIFNSVYFTHINPISFGSHIFHFSRFLFKIHHCINRQCFFFFFAVRLVISFKSYAIASM